MKIVKLGPNAKDFYCVAVTLPKSCVELKATPKGLILSEEELEFAISHGLKALIAKGAAIVDNYEAVKVVVKAPEPVVHAELPKMADSAPVVIEAPKVEEPKVEEPVVAEEPKIEEPKVAQPQPSKRNRNRQVEPTPEESK